MGRRSDIDWERVERDYRLGQKTDVEVAKTHGVSRSAMLRRAKKEGWTKDLSEQVKLQTKARISAEIVKRATEKVQQTDKHNRTAVEIEAIDNALKVAEHERIGTESRQFFEQIIRRASEILESTQTISDLAKMAAAEDPKLQAELRKVSSLPVLVDVAKRAIEGAAKSIEIERKARNMDDPNDRGTGIEDFLDKVGAELRGDAAPGG